MQANDIWVLNALKRLHLPQEVIGQPSLSKGSGKEFRLWQGNVQERCGPAGRESGEGTDLRLTDNHPLQGHNLLVKRGRDESRGQGEKQAVKCKVPNTTRDQPPRSRHAEPLRPVACSRLSLSVGSRRRERTLGGIYLPEGAVPDLAYDPVQLCMRLLVNCEVHADSHTAVEGRLMLAKERGGEGQLPSPFTWWTRGRKTELRRTVAAQRLGRATGDLVIHSHRKTLMRSPLPHCELFGRKEGRIRPR